MASPDVFLYWGSGSGPCWSVMIALHEKGIAFKDKLISFGEKEHKSEEIMKLNPRGQVPTLKIDNIVINESLASCHYLEKVYSSQGYKLIPDDPAQIASILQRAYETANFRKKVTEEVVYYMWRTKAEDRNEEALKTKKAEAVEEMQRWEAYLEQRGDGSHLASKDFSMADVVFFPTLAFLVRSGLKTSPRFPRLTAYYDLVKQRPSIQNSWPPHWKTSENTTLLADL